jgi:hypothetical protein
MALSLGLGLGLGFSRSGDDGITTHSCTNVVIRGCNAGWSRAVYSATNSNGFEIDDFSVNVDVINCYSERVHRGIELKGHSDAAAARGVSIMNFEAYKCRRGAWFRHQGYDTSTRSPTARDVVCQGLVVRHPHPWNVGTPSGDISCFGITGYENLLVSSVHLRQEAAPGNILGGASDEETGAVMYVASTCRGLSVTGLDIVGFGQAGYGVRVTSSAVAPQLFSNVTIQGGPQIGFSGGGVTKLVNATLVAEAGSRGAAVGGIGLTGVASDMRAVVSATGFETNIAA